jgi:hypothetical protein
MNNKIGKNNTACGNYALGLSTGSGNIALGDLAGEDLQTGDNNIYIGHSGEDKDNGIVRIGTEGTHKETHLAGDVTLGGKLRSPQWNVTSHSLQILNRNVTNSAKCSFTSNGGILLIIMSGTAYGEEKGLIELRVAVGKQTHKLRVYSIVPGHHMTFPTSVKLFTLAKGEHQLTVTPGTNTISDGSDVFNVTIIEFPFEHST